MGSDHQAHPGAIEFGALNRRRGPAKHASVRHTGRAGIFDRDSKAPHSSSAIAMRSLARHALRPRRFVFDEKRDQAI